jgi:hypothetical protein
MPPDDERDYEVGYGKAPRHTGFVKGHPATRAAARPAPRI